MDLKRNDSNNFNISNIDNLLKCPICYDYFNTAMLLPKCSHNYCSFCIRTALSFNERCPLCRIDCNSTQLLNNRHLDLLVQNYKKNLKEQEQLNSIIKQQDKIEYQKINNICKCAQNDNNNNNNNLNNNTINNNCNSNNNDNNNNSNNSNNNNNIINNNNNKNNSNNSNNNNKKSTPKKRLSLLEDNINIDNNKINQISPNKKSKTTSPSSQSPPPKPMMTRSRARNNNIQLEKENKEKEDIGINQNVNSIHVNNNQDVNNKSQDNNGNNSSQNNNQNDINNSDSSNISQSVNKGENGNVQDVNINNISKDTNNNDTNNNDINNKIINIDENKSNSNKYNGDHGDSYNNSDSLNDDGKIECPFCKIRIKKDFINIHANECLNSGEIKQNNFKDSHSSIYSNSGSGKYLPKVVYSIMNSKQLKDTLAKAGLKTTGDKQTLIKRHKEYLTRYNSEVDSLNPKSNEEITNELYKNENERKKIPNSQFFDQDKQFEKLKQEILNRKNNK